MLTITIPPMETFDDETQMFRSVDGVVLELEHSLAALSEWESKWEKPFLGETDKSTEETFSYILCMSQTPGLSVETLFRLSQDNVKAINDYIEAKMTATTFSSLPGRPNRQIVTAEIIYHWMIALNIPLECEHWHLNKLFTLVKVLNEKNSPPKKMSVAEAQAEQRRLNKQRREQMASQG